MFGCCSDQRWRTANVQRGVLEGDEEADSECKSVKAIWLLREVTTLLSQTTDQPSKHVAKGQVGPLGSNALHNFRTLFSP